MIYRVILSGERPLALLFINGYLFPQGRQVLVQLVIEQNDAFTQEYNPI